MEEVHTYRRRLGTVVLYQTLTIDISTIVAVTQTTGDIATYIVIIIITQIRIDPL